MATRVQSKANGANGVNTIDAVMDSNVTAGNKLVAIVKYGIDFTPDPSMMSDTSSGDAWTLDWDVSSQIVGVGALADHAVFSKVVTVSGPCTVTFNPAGSTGRIAIAVREYSGLGAHDGTTRSVTFLTNNGTPTSGSFTPAAANGVILAFVSSSQTVTFEAGYDDTNGEGVNGRLWTAVDESVTAEAQAADATQSAALWDCGALWYPDAASGRRFFLNS